MSTATAERRQAAVFVGIPGKGEIGREEILEALRRAGLRTNRIRQQASEAARRSSVCKDRRFE
jgi:hypothetical protein